MKPDNPPPGVHPPQSDVAPPGYPSADQNYYAQPPPMQPTAYPPPPPGYAPQGQQYPYGQQPYFQQAYTQPPPAQPYTYPPMVGTHPGPAPYHDNGYGGADPYRPKPAHQGAQQGAAIFYDPEAAGIQAAQFAEKSVRMGFVRKVFAILSLMLTVTVAVVLVFMYVDSVHNYLRQNVWPFWTSFAVSFGVLIYLTCHPTAARKYPANMIALSLFTICQSVLIGTVTMYSSPQAVLIAASATLGITIVLTLFATQTKFDFTPFRGMLLGVLVVLLICTLLGIFIRVKWFYVVISGIGALLFCAFLVFDIQLIMGKGRHALSPDDYVFGALALYLDIINIFLYILSLVGLVGEK